MYRLLNTGLIHTRALVEMGGKIGEITNQLASLPDTVIRKANRWDAELIMELGKRAFYEAFAELTAPEDMVSYLKTSFSIDAIRAQLNK